MRPLAKASCSPIARSEWNKGQMKNKARLLGISGSIRRDSFNTAILNNVASIIEDQATLTLFPLNEIPLYNQDLDGSSTPSSVSSMREAIGEADGVIIATPEYNHGMSGVLKNALDWASRPFGASTLTGKPVLTLSSSPASTGGVRAQAQLNDALIAIAAQLALRPQIVIASAHQRVQDGRLTDEATIKFLRAGVDDLLANIARNASAIREEARLVVKRAS